MFLDILYSILSFVFALLLPKYLLKESEQKHRVKLQWLIVYHFIFGVAYYFYTRDGGGDAWGYYNLAKDMTFSDFKISLLYDKGTFYMIAFNYVFANLMGMGFFANTMFYSLLGSLGLVYFYLIAIRSIPYVPKLNSYSLFPLIFFLPNLHFWSAGVGKDTILFLCIGMFSYGMMKPFSRIPLIIISLLPSYAIRPQVVFVMIIAFGLSYIFSSRARKFEKIVFSLLAIVSSIAILPNVMEYLMLEELSLTYINSSYSAHADILSQGSGSGIDVSSYPYPLKVLTFLYRPLFFDVNNAIAVVASVENLILLILTFMVLKKSTYRAYKNAPTIIKALLFLLILGALLFSISLGNLGIMLRIRNMLLPGMLIYILWALSFQQKEKYNMHILKLKHKQQLEQNED